MTIGVGLSNGSADHSSWRHPRNWANSNISLDYYKTTAIKAEEGKLDFIFLGDTLFVNENSHPNLLNRLEPVTVLSSLAGVTSHIGLVGTASTTYSEPFNVARQFSSLDHISNGRAGWNIVTSAFSATNSNFSKDEHLEHDRRYDLAEEFVEVAKGLWDSWEEDAFIVDKETGIFFDREKLHKLNHKGEFFSVQGPIPIARSRQGRPVLFQAGSSDAARELASKVADAMFTHAYSLTSSQEFYQDVKARSVANGRSRDDILILPGIKVIVGETDADADRKYKELTDLIDIHKALLDLSKYYDNTDFGTYPLDEAFPDMGDTGYNAFRGRAEVLNKVAREHSMTLREVALWNILPKDSLFIGSPHKVADQLQEWFEAEAADGFIVGTGPIAPEGLFDFVDYVIPILQERGLFRTDYAADTFHENLNLPIPVNRYTKQG
nr:LLM class flavin-dependent oxidoreductase [Paenibacillus periandrae]